MQETELDSLFRNKTWVKEKGFYNLECERCGNCCPAADCGLFSSNQGVATCANHINNSKRVGCGLPPLFHYQAGIACSAVESRLRDLSLPEPRKKVANSLGQIVYESSEYFRRFP